MGQHGDNQIRKIRVPDATAPEGYIDYEIHDAKAFHDIDELGLASAVVFKGTKPTKSEVFKLDNAKRGDVWLVTSTGTEYICTETITQAHKEVWQELGDIHDAASSTHTHDANVTGANSESTVTGTVTVPTVSVTKKYLTASAEAPNVTPTTTEVLGKKASFTCQVTPSTLQLVKTTVATVVSNGSATAGKAASLTMAVDDKGVLSFNFVANKPTSVTMPTFSSVDVATGSLGTNGTGATVVTGISSASVSVAQGSNTVSAITGITVAAPTITLKNNEENVTGAVDNVDSVSIGAIEQSIVNGKAAAQAWTQKSGSTGTPNG